MTGEATQATPRWTRDYVFEQLDAERRRHPGDAAPAPGSTPPLIF